MRAQRAFHTAARAAILPSRPLRGGTWRRRCHYAAGPAPPSDSPSQPPQESAQAISFSFNTFYCFFFLIVFRKWKGGGPSQSNNTFGAVTRIRVNLARDPSSGEAPPSSDGPRVDDTLSKPCTLNQASRQKNAAVPHNFCARGSERRLRTELSVVSGSARPGWVSRNVPEPDALRGEASVDSKPSDPMGDPKAGLPDIPPDSPLGVIIAHWEDWPSR